MIWENDDVITDAEKSRHYCNIFTENGNGNSQAIAVIENTDSYDKKIDGAMIMENFSLSDAFFVDDEVLDSQHALILGCMAFVSGYLSAGIKGRDLFEVVDRLDAYCKLHFLDEEKLMERMEFAAIEAHKAQHALFVTHLEKFMGRSEELSRAKRIEELNSLKGWYLDHIVNFDRKYSEQRLRSPAAARN